MILTAIKLFNELMEFLDSDKAVDATWGPEYLKTLLDEKSKNLAPKEAKDMDKEELTAYIDEIEVFTKKLETEVMPYIKESTRRMLYGFADDLTDFLNL